MKNAGHKQKKALSIRQKMFLFILAPIIIVLIAAFAFVLIDFKFIVKANAEEFIQSQAESYSVKVQNELNYFIEANRFLKQTFENYEAIPMANRRKELSSLMSNLLNRNPKILSIWSIWELNTIDNLEQIYANKPGSTILGNFRYLYYREGEKIILSDYVEKNSKEVFNGKLYNSAKLAGKEIVVTHFYLDYNQNRNKQVLQTNIVMPLYNKDRFIGVVGVDMELENIQNIIQNISHIENGEIYLFSSNGMCISSPNKDQHGLQLEKILQQEEAKYDLLNLVKEGKKLNFYHSTENKKYFYTFCPVDVGQTNAPWSLLIKLPYSYIENQTQQSIQLAFKGGVIVTLLILVIIIIFSNNISKPLVNLSYKMDMIGEGQYSESYTPSKSSSFEIQKIAQSYNQINKTMKNSTHFAEAIGRGIFDSDYELLSDKDQLGTALLEMREKLKKASLEESTRHEAEQRSFWTTNGLGMLNDILREHENIEEYSFKIISFITKYLGASVGGIFIKEQIEKNRAVLELKSSYAFERRKYINKTIEFGDGLVGSCALEKETIHLNNVPKDYLKITSGLGSSNPENILLIPMKLENELMGVIELASFKIFEKYQIEFLEQASISIASSLKMASSNSSTKELLEKMQQQAEEMSAQEEEMRQNMEELLATQEESSRRVEEYEKKIIELQLKNEELLKIIGENK